MISSRTAPQGAVSVRRVWLLAPALAAALMVAPVLPAQAQAQQVTVTQGDEIFVLRDDQGEDLRLYSCRIGYMLPDGRALTAGHCGQPGSQVYISTNVGQPAIGTFDLPPEYSFITYDSGGQWAANDFAYINFTPDVLSGGNPISGDGRGDASTMSVGEEVCFAGQDEVKCGPLIGTRDESIYFAADGRMDDSGGPVFSPEHGLLGVVSMGDFGFTDPITQQEVSLTVGAMEKIGQQAPTPADHSRVIAEYLQSVHGNDIQFVAPGMEGNTGTGAGDQGAQPNGTEGQNPADESLGQQPIEVSFRPAPPVEGENDGTPQAAQQLLGSPIPWIFGVILLLMSLGAIAVKRKARVDNHAVSDSELS